MMYNYIKRRVFIPKIEIVLVCLRPILLMDLPSHLKFRRITSVDFDLRKLIECRDNVGIFPSFPVELAANWR